jgi:hypothetical protein
LWPPAAAVAGALDAEVVGEEANKRLAVLVASSRLLDQPLGAIVRGPAGCGKSALIQSISRALPASEVLNLSRLTPQSLYFMPSGALQNKLLVVDEYTGLQESEYAIRTLMSNARRARGCGIGRRCGSWRCPARGPRSWWRRTWTTFRCRGGSSSSAEARAARTG